MGEGETYSSCRESSAGETEAQGQKAAFPARTVEWRRWVPLWRPQQHPSVSSSLWSSPSFPVVEVFPWQHKTPRFPGSTGGMLGVLGSRQEGPCRRLRFSAQGSSSKCGADTPEGLFFPFEGLPWWLSW